MTLMTDQRGRGVSIFGQTVAMAAAMEEVSERNYWRESAGSGSSSSSADKAKEGEAAAPKSLQEVAKETLAAVNAPLPTAKALTPSDNDAGLPPLLLAPPFAPGISMVAPPPDPVTPARLIDESFFGMRVAEIPDWVSASLALEDCWENMEALEEKNREKARLVHEWAPPRALSLDLLLGDSRFVKDVPDGEPGGSGREEDSDPLMRLMAGVLPGVDDSEFFNFRNSSSSSSSGREEGEGEGEEERELEEVEPAYEVERREKEEKKMLWIEEQRAYFKKYGWDTRFRGRGFPRED